MSNGSTTTLGHSPGDHPETLPHEALMGRERNYLKALIHRYPGTTDFETGAGRIYLDLMNNLPVIPDLEAGRSELCHRITEVVYPLAARLLAQAVAITFKTAAAPILPPPAIDALSTYVVFDCEKGLMRHWFLSQHHDMPSQSDLTISEGLALLCVPFNYHYHEIKEDRPNKVRHAASALPNRDWPNRAIDAPEYDPLPKDWTKSAYKHYRVPLPTSRERQDLDGLPFGQPVPLAKSWLHLWSGAAYQATTTLPIPFYHEAPVIPTETTFEPLFDFASDSAMALDKNASMVAKPLSPLSGETPKTLENYYEFQPLAQKVWRHQLALENNQKNVIISLPAKPVPQPSPVAQPLPTATTAVIPEPANYYQIRQHLLQPSMGPGPFNEG